MSLCDLHTPISQGSGSEATPETLPPVPFYCCQTGDERKKQSGDAHETKVFSPFSLQANARTIVDMSSCLGERR